MVRLIHYDEDSPDEKIRKGLESGVQAFATTRSLRQRERSLDQEDADREIRRVYTEALVKKIEAETDDIRAGRAQRAQAMGMDAESHAWQMDRKRRDDEEQFAAKQGMAAEWRQRFGEEPPPELIGPPVEGFDYDASSAVPLEIQKKAKALEPYIGQMDPREARLHLEDLQRDTAELTSARRGAAVLQRAIRLTQPGVDGSEPALSSEAGAGGTNSVEKVKQLLASGMDPDEVDALLDQDVKRAQQHQRSMRIGAEIVGRMDQKRQELHALDEEMQRQGLGGLDPSVFDQFDSYRDLINSEAGRLTPEMMFETQRKAYALASAGRGGTTSRGAGAPKQYSDAELRKIAIENAKAFLGENGQLTQVDVDREMAKLRGQDFQEPLPGNQEKEARRIAAIPDVRARAAELQKLAAAEVFGKRGAPGSLEAIRAFADRIGLGEMADEQARAPATNGAKLPINGNAQAAPAKPPEMTDDEKRARAADLRQQAKAARSGKLTAEDEEDAREYDKEAEKLEKGLASAAKDTEQKKSLVLNDNKALRAALKDLGIPTLATRKQWAQATTALTAADPTRSRGDLLPAMRALARIGKERGWTMPKTKEEREALRKEK